MNIGIFGGCFNPPHRMHKKMARDLLDKRFIDKLIFVPTGDRYVKKDLATGKDRYNMLSLILENNMEVSDFELTDELINTYKTLSYFKCVYPEDNIFFVCGTDNLAELDTWRDYDKILRDFKILVIKRGNDNVIELLAKYDSYKNNIIITDIEKDSLSSIIVREKLKSCLSYDILEKYLEKPVLNYIKENNIYEIRD